MAWSDLKSCLSGVNDRFGIEDILGIQDRSVDMQSFNLDIFGANRIRLFSENGTLTASTNNTIAFGNPRAELYASDSSDEVSISAIPNEASVTYGLSGYTSPLKMIFPYASSAGGDYYIPLTVNNIAADSTGNITLTSDAIWKAILTVAYTAGGIGSGVTTYGQLTGNNTAFGSESTRSYVIPENAVASHLYIDASGTQPNTGDLVVTLRKNGGNTALTVTIPASSTSGIFSDTTHSVSVSAGDVLSLQWANGASTTSIPPISAAISLTNP